MDRKTRLTVSVDPELVAAGRRAVKEGRAASVSEWVSEALASRVAQERRLEALDMAIEAYVLQFGEFTEEEIEAQRRADRERAVVAVGRRRQDSTGRG